MEGSRLRKVMLFICIALFCVMTYGLIKIGFLDHGDFKSELWGTSFFAYIITGVIWGIVRFDFIYRGIFGTFGIIFGAVAALIPYFLISIAGMIMLPIDIILTILNKPLEFPFE